MNILVCVKRVPATGGRITLTADGRDIDTRYLGFTVSPHEECAVEEAVRIVEAQGGSSTVLTLGPEVASEQLRDAMAIGIERAVLLETDGADWDPIATAGAIVDAIRALEADGEPFDLLLFGNEAADTGDFQVGIRVADRARPAVRDRHQGDRGRPTGASSPGARPAGGWEVFELPLPAVLAVKEGLNLPRYPSVPGRLRAKKKEIVRMTPSRAPGRPDEGATAAAGGQREHGRGDRQRARRRRRPSSSCSPGSGCSADDPRPRRARGRPAGAAVARGAEPRSAGSAPATGRAGPRRPVRRRGGATPPAQLAGPRHRRRPRRRGRPPGGVRAGGLGGVDRPARGGHAPVDRHGGGQRPRQRGHGPPRRADGPAARRQLHRCRAGRPAPAHAPALGREPPRGRRARCADEAPDGRAPRRRDRGAGGRRRAHPRSSRSPRR